MRRDELKELHYITHVQNLSSILTRGLLSHHTAEAIAHRSVAMGEIQARRTQKDVPGGQTLHSYVNLYINARNPMMYKRHEQHRELCVLKVSLDLLDLPGVVIADQNASSDYCRFRPAPGGLAYIDARLVMAEYWTHPNDPIAEMRHKSVMCAEVLVPNQVGVASILGVYVSCPASQQVVLQIAPSLSVQIDGHLFFQK